MSPINLPLDVSALKGVTLDSRSVEPGFLFAALRGETVDGRDYIDDAIARGASAIITSPDVEPRGGGVQFILSDNPRREFSHIVSAFYDAQPEHVIAVTGTNGKSSVVHFVDQLLGALGHDASFIGTLSGKLTTPDPVSLHKTLAELSEGGVNHVALEASSHGLMQYRLDGVRVSVAAFTSFSQDHLDYHQDMTSYLAAKTRLFTDVLRDGGTAVLNADIPEFDDGLRKLCEQRGLSMISYGQMGANIKLAMTEVKAEGQLVDVLISGERHKINLPLVGGFQVMNALCALGCVMAFYPDRVAEIVRAMENLEPVPGRLQCVSDGTRRVYVDYAHTPDALETVLRALRPHTAGKLVCVFGCGGDRDKSKRSLMGAIAAKLADSVIVTDDNPRSEDGALIRKQIMTGAAGAAHLEEVGYRREAIAKAIVEMKEEDVVLVAGKGHEQGQIFADHTEPFDDAAEVLNILKNS